MNWIEITAPKLLGDWSREHRPGREPRGRGVEVGVIILEEIDNHPPLVLPISDCEGKKLDDGSRDTGSKFVIGVIGIAAAAEIVSRCENWLVVIVSVSRDVQPPTLNESAWWSNEKDDFKVVTDNKSLNKIEKSYEIHDKEMLVVIRGLEK